MSGAQMPKIVMHLFHADDASLNAGSHVAQRIQEVAPAQQIQVEVYCFGPAQDALTDVNDSPVRRQYNAQVDALVASGVLVSACLSAANASGTTEALASRGIKLEFARDAFVRYALEGATVVTF